MWGLWWLLVLFLLVSLSYGWGYRRWGPPYPSAYRRRRPSLADRPAPAATVRTTGWGMLADLVVLVALVVVVWFLFGLFL